MQKEKRFVWTGLMDGMSSIDGTCWIHFCCGPLLLQPVAEAEGQPYLMPTCSLLISQLLQSKNSH